MTSIQQNSSIPNIAVLIPFIFFFPAGLLLILIRAILDRKKPYAAMKNHQFSSRLLLIFFGIMSFSFLVLSQSEDEAPIFPFFMGCTILFLLPALYMQMRAKQLKKKLDEEEMRRKLAEREWFEHQQRMQWNAAQQQQQLFAQHQWQQNMIQHQYQQNAVQQQRQQNAVQYQQQNAAVNQQNINAAPAQPRTVTCTGCGARTAILPKENKNCDYCGFVLSYPQS